MIDLTGHNKSLLLHQWLPHQRLPQGKCQRYTEQENLVVFDPLYRLFAGVSVSVQGALLRSHQARIRDGGQGGAGVHPAGHL